MVKIKHTNTFLDLLDLVEARLNDLLPSIKGALDQIKKDFKVDQSDTYIRMNNCINDLDDFIGHLDCLRSDRNAAADITISIPNELASQAEVAAEDAQYALENAASVLNGLEYGIVDGHMKGDDRFVLAVMRLTSRALMEVAEKEGATMARVASLIRQEQGARASANLAKAA